MKRSKRIYVLLGVLAAVCIATFAVFQIEEYKEKISDNNSIVLELSVEEVTSLSWEYDGATFAFHNEDGWIYDEDAAFPVDEDKIDQLLSQFEAFRVAFVIEDVEDYDQYGLEDPVCIVHIETEQQSYEIKIGNYSEIDSQRYVSLGDGNVYLAMEDPLSSFDISISDMIKHDATPIFLQVNEIVFAGVENYYIYYQEDSPDTYCDSDVYFTEQNGDVLPLSSQRVNDYLDDISILGLIDYVTYNVSEEELTSYGLTSPELTIIIAYTEESDTGEEIDNQFVLYVSRDPEELAAKENSQDDEETDTNAEDEEDITAYARVGNSQIVYQISAEDYLALTAASYDDLRHEEVFTADFAKITQIDISLEGTEYTVSTEKDGNQILYFYQEDELTISDLQNALTALSAAQFTDERPTGQEEISLTLYLDDENHPQVQIQLYRYDGSSCLAVVDGTPICLVARSQAVDLIEAVHAIVLN